MSIPHLQYFDYHNNISPTSTSFPVIATTTSLSANPGEVMCNVPSPTLARLPLCLAGGERLRLTHCLAAHAPDSGVLTVQESTTSGV